MDREKSGLVSFVDGRLRIRPAPKHAKGFGLLSRFDWPCLASVKARSRASWLLRSMRADDSQPRFGFDRTKSADLFDGRLHFTIYASSI